MWIWVREFIVKDWFQLQLQFFENNYHFRKSLFQFPWHVCISSRKTVSSLIISSFIFIIHLFYTSRYVQLVSSFFVCFSFCCLLCIHSVRTNVCVCLSHCFDYSKNDLDFKHFDKVFESYHICLWRGQFKIQIRIDDAYVVWLKFTT